MGEPAEGGDGDATDGRGQPVRYLKRDFWSTENLKHVPAHYRLRKTARIVNGIAGERPCTLLDVGCGPATLMGLLRPNVSYFGIDIAIHDPAPNLLQADIVEEPIRFGDRKFDIVVAQGLFEYLGDVQSQKFGEIADVLEADGVFVVSYTNFGHRNKDVYWAYSNVQSLDRFRGDLGRFFTIQRAFPTAHNWHHGQPNRRLVKALNMHVNVNIPVISPALAVEYFFICSARRSRPLGAGSGEGPPAR